MLKYIAKCWGMVLQVMLTTLPPPDGDGGKRSMNAALINSNLIYLK